MKISIITLHYIYNYGSVLQTYATQKKFEEHGYEVKIVNYIRQNVRNEVNLNWNTNIIKKIIYKVYKNIDNKKKENVFTDFIKRRINLTIKYNTVEELFSNPPISDVYCVGSDQTWNSDYNGGVLPEYFLEYAPENSIKVAYSASIGKENLTTTEKQQVKEYTKKFSQISVRENSALKILSDIEYNNAIHVLDPTLILKKEDWYKLTNNPKIRRPYILVYQLNPDEKMNTFVRSFSDKHNLKVLNVCYKMQQRVSKGKKIYCPSVEDFLTLIRYADYIITDSFHGTAFSLNFNKQFYAFYPDKYSTRIKSILELTDLEDRAITDINADYVKEDIDYSKVNYILDKEREKTDLFINEINNKI